VQNESPSLLYGSPNLTDKNHFEPFLTSLYFKDFAPLCRLSRLKQFQFFKLFSPFLNTFLYLGFFEKHTSNESECIFWGQEGLSGLTAGSLWLIVQVGKGFRVRVRVDPCDKNLQILDL